MGNGKDLPDCTYSLPNGAILDSGGYAMNITSYPEVPSITYPNMSDSLPLDFFVIYYSNNTHRIEALECALRFCGQTYNTTVKLGQTTTKVTDTWGQLTLVEVLTDGVDDVNYYLLQGRPTNFTVNSLIPIAMEMPANQLFQGLNSLQQMGSQFQSEGNMYQDSSGAQAIWDTLSTNDEMAAMASLMDNLAVSLTNRFVFTISLFFSCLSTLIK
jgi:hypothetical protein